eukprot:GEMP01002757.1.p1 GENE.GEMP01002757.1~~GEMP01002757.1.p1  ORF type:complete len:919 (+),score=226.44 GEMP01002757.1:234-2990(+)
MNGESHDSTVHQVATPDVMRFLTVGVAVDDGAIPSSTSESAEACTSEDAAIPHRCPEAFTSDMFRGDNECSNLKPTAHDAFPWGLGVGRMGQPQQIDPQGGASPHRRLHPRQDASPSADTAQGGNVGLEEVCEDEKRVEEKKQEPLSPTSASGTKDSRASSSSNPDVRATVGSSGLSVSDDLDTPRKRAKMIPPFVRKHSSSPESKGSRVKAMRGPLDGIAEVDSILSSDTPSMGFRPSKNSILADQQPEQGAATVSLVVRKPVLEIARGADETTGDNKSDDDGTPTEDSPMSIIMDQKVSMKAKVKFYLQSKNRRRARNISIVDTCISNFLACPPTPVVEMPRSLPCWVVLTRGRWQPFKHVDQAALEKAFADGKEETVPVECGRFDVYVKEREVRPAYWEGEARQVVRGTYFYGSGIDRAPVPESEVRALDKAYKKAMKNMSSLPLIFPLKLEKKSEDVYDVVFSENGKKGFLDYDGMSTAEPLCSTLELNKGGFAAKNFDFRRGYGQFMVEGEASEAALSAKPTAALIFVLHGIGELQSQKKWEKTGTPPFSDPKKMTPGDTGFSKFRQGVDLQRREIHAHLVASNAQCNIELLPIEWWRAVHGSKDDASAMRLRRNLDNTRLKNVQQFREFVNFTLSDGILYTDGTWQKKIHEYVLNTIASVYAKFCARTTQFEGNIAVLSHSLGGVVAYDLFSNDFQAKVAQFSIPGTPRIPDPLCVLTMGCPLGLFLSIRESNSEEEESLMLRRDFRLFNIFHPDDVIAYRLEPLIDEKYKDLDPVVIRHKGGYRMHYGIRNTVKTLTEWTSGWFSSKSKSKHKSEKKETVEDGDVDISNSSDGAEVMERLDFALQETEVEAMNEVVSAAGSHFTYWDHPDIAAFIATAVVETAHTLKADKPTSEIRTPIRSSVSKLQHRGA